MLLEILIQIVHLPCGHLGIYSLTGTWSRRGEGNLEAKLELSVVWGITNFYEEFRVSRLCRDTTEHKFKYSWLSSLAVLEDRHTEGVG